MGRPVTVPDLLRARASRNPDAVAHVAGGVRLTLRQWDDRADEATLTLINRGVVPGDGVALLFDTRRWLEFAVAYVAVLRVGAVAVPVSPGLPDSDRDRVLRHCRSALVVGPADLTPANGAAAAAAVSAAPDDVAEILYPDGVLRAPATRAFTHAELLAGGQAFSGVTAGAVVHAFAPGTPLGQEVLRLPLLAEDVVAVTAPVFEPAGFVALLAEASEFGPVSCGLTPSMARALPVGLPRVVVSRAGDGGPAAEEDGAEVAPLATAQDGMVWHEQFSPGSFNLAPAVRRYRGPLDVAAFEAALNEILRRHAALRTTFSIHDGRGVQVFPPHRWRALPVLDLSGLPGAERMQQLAAFVADGRRRPFDLVVGPLFDPTLVRLGPDDHVMVIRSHHAVYDDWSVGLFRRELSALYSAFAAGAPSPLPELPATLPDVARRQDAERRGPAGAADADFWRRELEGAPCSVALPIDDPSRPAGSPHSAPPPLSLDLPPALAAALQSLARSQRATTFTALLAAFAVLVERYTGQDDVVVSTLAANRPTTDLENLIGCFGKKVLVRLRLSDDPPFPELVTRTRRAVMAAITHQAPAYEAVVQEVLGPGAAAHGLAPQIGLKFQAAIAPTDKLALAGLEVSGIDLPPPASGAAHFLAGAEGPTDQPLWGGGLYLGVFLGISVAESGGGLRLVTEGVFHAPEVERLLSHFRVLLDDIAADPDRRLSELRVVASPPERSMVHEPPAARPGAQTTIDAAFAAASRRSSDRTALVWGDQAVTFADLDRRAAVVATDLDRRGAGPTVTLPERGPPDVDLVAQVLGAWRTGRSISVGAPTGGPTAGPRPGEEGPAYFVDGVAVSHAGLLSTGDAIQTAVLPAESEPRRVCLPPLPASGSFIRGVLMVAAGHTAHLMARPLAEDPEACVALLARGEVDVVDCDTSEFGLLLGAGLQAGLHERVLRAGPRPIVLVSTDRAIAPEAWAGWRAIASAEVFVLHGPPGCGFGATLGRVSGGAARPSVGHPLPGIGAAVVDGLGRPVPVRALGTLVLTGPHVAGADRQGVLDTGRPARALLDGSVELVGGDREIDLRGFRVQPGRIEAALAGCPGVAAVSVVASRDAASPSAVRLVAHVVPHDASAPPALHDLRRWLWSRLPGYAWPSALAVVDHLPAPAGVEVSDTEGTVAPDAVFLAAAWAEALGREGFSTADNYWQSFAFLDVRAELAAAGHRIPSVHVTRNRTLETLAADRAAHLRRSDENENR